MCFANVNAWVGFGVMKLDEFVCVFALCLRVFKRTGEQRSQASTQRESERERPPTFPHYELELKDRASV